jgi:N-acetylneuraminic acid mutarotase
LRALRAILVILLIAILVAASGVAWLFTVQPEPRAAVAWSLGPPLPAARGELATATGYADPCLAPPCADAERLFVLGGLSGLFEPQRSVTVYDPNRRTWAVGPSLPAPRHHFAAAALGDALYVSGGTDVAGAHLGHQYWPPLNNFWRLTPGADRWEALPPMLEPRWGHRMVAHDGRLYVVGGRGPSGLTLIYTPGKGWKTGAKLPRFRDHLSVVVAAGKLWAIGGRDPNSITRVDLYDPVADDWQPGPDLPHATSGAAEAVHDGVIFIFGGEETDFFRGEVNDRHWKLDTRSEAPRWEPAPKPPLAVHGTVGAVIQDRIAIAGGASRHGAYSVAGWTNLLQLIKPAVAR